MKKSISCILAALSAIVVLSGCDFFVSRPVDGMMLPESETDTTFVVVGEHGITEAELRALFDENLYCMWNVFEIDCLEYGEEPVKGDSIYRVTERFSSYEDFEGYLRSVYCKETADMLLYDFPQEGNPRYLNIDGELCVDITLVGGKGYYVDWTDYTIEIVSSDDTSCTFVVKGILNEPADVPVDEEYSVAGVAVYEDGKWVLERMMH